MAEWVAFIVVAVVALFFAAGAVVGFIVGVAWSEERFGWLAALPPAAIAAALFHVASSIAPFTIVAAP